MTTTNPLGADRLLPNRWLVLALMLGIAIFNHADRYLLAALVEPIKSEFTVSDGFMGLLMGPAFAVLYSIMAIPFAIYADKHSRIRIIVIGCVVWSMFTALSGFVSNPWQLAGARIGVGVGEAAFQAPAYALLAAYFPEKERGKAFAVMALATYLGQMLGYGGGPAVAEIWDWRAAFMLFGALGLAIIVIAWLVVKEPARVETPPVRQPLVPMASRLFRLGSFATMTVGMALGVMSGIAFGFWGPSLFARSYGLSITEAGSAFGAAFVIPGIIGAIGFGIVSDKLVQKGYQRILIMSALALSATTCALIATAWAPTLQWAILLAIPAGLMGGGWPVGLFAALQYVLPDHMRSTGTAIALLCVNMLGYVVGPWLVGTLSGVFGEGADGLRMAMVMVVPAGLIGALLIWWSARYLIADRERLAQNA